MLDHFLTAIFAMIAPFGSWESPITTDLIVQESISFCDMQTDGEAIYWTELHPKEKGRLALVKYTPDRGQIPLAETASVRSRVHEYGGGAFCVHEETVYFSNDSDRQIYSLDQRGQQTQLTNMPNCRFADGCVSPDGKSLYWVCEEHKPTGEVDNYLVRIDFNKVHCIASGQDFFSSPRISPDGKKLAFITWDFPNMPWDGTTLWLAEIGTDGELHKKKALAGGPDESICQIQWSSEGVLHFVSDKSGFWNLYRLKNERVECLCEKKAEFGIPAWVFGRPTYAFLPNGQIVCMYAEKGIDRLGLIDPDTHTLQDLGQPYTMVQNLITYKDKVYLFTGSPTQPPSLICFDPNTKQTEVLKQSFQTKIPSEWIAKPEVIEYPSLDGKTGYAFYYPPTNPDFQPLKGEKPPLLVKCHGGPTARSYCSLSLEVQYWTSRGIALLDVNYGGSTGFGREYFKRLEGNWGILDVEDTIRAAKFLVEKGVVDEKRLLIRGGSAGGYTVLCALAFHDIFAGGTSYFGVSDLLLLYEDTHKFEAQYTDRLVGPYPEASELIRERSPINHIEKLRAPVLLLQGDQDKIVPPNQTFEIFEGLKKRKTPVGMILFEGEGHGFRSAPNIKRALDAELYFYSKILGFDLAEPMDEAPVEIMHLD